jgi:hypothetical protein
MYDVLCDGLLLVVVVSEGWTRLVENSDIIQHITIGVSSGTKPDGMSTDAITCEHELLCNNVLVSAWRETLSTHKALAYGIPTRSLRGGRNTLLRVGWH